MPPLTDPAGTAELSPHSLSTLQELLSWYETNLCNVQLNDPRGYRVRFNVEDFVHLVKLTNKYGQEPKNRRLAIADIRRGNISSESGRFDRQRALDLPRARQISTRPDYICPNWQGVGDEVYVKNFGSEAAPQYRVLVCKVRGTGRIAITIFPRERIAQRDIRNRIWPSKSQGGQ